MKRFIAKKQRVFLGILCLGVLFSVGCSKEKAALRESSHWTARGDSALAESEWDDAVHFYTQAIRLNPANTDALYGRSSVRLATGKEFYILARAAAGEGEVTQAKEIAVKADRDFALAAEDAASYLKIDPNAARACYVLGCVAVYQGDWDGAVDAFTKTIERDPAMASAYQRRGEVYGFVNDIENESADLKKAAELGYHSEGGENLEPDSRDGSVRTADSGQDEYRF